MATRMQQRRGTAAQWTSANPILNAGEMGWESDTNKFKIGDGTNHWADLDYFIDQSSTVNPAFGSSIVFEGATANAFETTLAVTDPTADRTITLPDSTGTVVVADGSGNVTVSGNLTVQGTTTTIDSSTIAVTNSFVFEGSTANDYETTLTVTEPTADRTLTLQDATGTIALTADVVTHANLTLAHGASGAVVGTTNEQTLTNKTLTSPIINMPTVSGLVLNDSSIMFEGSTADDFETALTVINPTADRVINLPDATGTVITTGNVSDLSFNTNIIFEGATANDFETTLAITDPTADRTITLPDASGTVALTADIATHESDTTTVHGIADTADLVTKAGAQTLGGAKTFTGDTVLPVNTSIGTVTSTEIGYLDGVTSAIQTQIDAKAPLASPTFTGTVTLPANTISQSMMADDSVGTNEIGGLAVTTEKIAEGAVTSAKIANDTIVNGDINASAAIDQSKIANLTTDLAAKAALSGATFTGAVTLHADPSSAMHAATKQYVDAATAGLNVHESVDVATTANITNTLVAEDLENGKTIDGVTLVTGQRVLVKNQTTKSENGIYIVPANGVASRADDYNSAGEVDAGDFIFVEAGTVNGKTGWVQTNVITTVGTDNIEFTQFSGAGTYAAGTNLDLTGNTFSVIAAPTFSGLVTASASGVAFSDGTQTKEGVPSRTAISTITDTYNLSSGGVALRDTLVECNKATGFTVTIPLNSTTPFPVGTSIDFLQIGAGQVTFDKAVGVTLNATPGFKLRSQWSSATLFKRATDSWVLMGDLSA